MTPDVGFPDDDRLSAWLDGELDASDRAEVEHWRRSDPAWAHALDTLAETREIVRHLIPAEPPSDFIEELVHSVSSTVTDLEVARRRRSRRATAGLTAVAAAAAVLIAVVVPSAARVRPALATDVRVHQAGVSASSDPVSGLAPLGTTMKLGR